MAVYRCHECDTWKDDDYFPCEIHPRYSNELICPDCLLELPEEKPSFTKLQQDIIKRMENDSE